MSLSNHRGTKRSGKRRVAARRLIVTMSSAANFKSNNSFPSRRSNPPCAPPAPAKFDVNPQCAGQHPATVPVTVTRCVGQVANLLDNLKASESARLSKNSTSARARLCRYAVSRASGSLSRVVSALSSPLGFPGNGARGTHARLSQDAPRAGKRYSAAGP